MKVDKWQKYIFGGIGFSVIQMSFGYDLRAIYSLLLMCAICLIIICDLLYEIWKKSL